MACVCSATSLSPEPAAPTVASAVPATQPAQLSGLRPSELAAVERSPSTFLGPSCSTDTSANPDAAGVRPCTCSGEVTVIARAEFSADGQSMTLERTVDGETSVNNWTRDPEHREQWIREVDFDDGLSGGKSAHRTDRVEWIDAGYNFSASIEFSDNTTTLCKPRTFTRQP